MINQNRFVMRTFTYCFLPTTILALITSISLFAQPNISHTEEHSHSEEPMAFVANQNQWHENVLFKTAFEGKNALFLEQKAFTYLLVESAAIEKLHDLAFDFKRLRNGFPIGMHAYKVHFVNANNVIPNGIGKQKTYHNYFLGNDPEKWAGNVPLFEEIFYKNIYNDIDLAAYSCEGHFKYDFIVAPYGDATQVRLEYEGADRLELQDGHLKISTSVETITEYAPYVYQLINGQKVEIEAKYILNGNQLSFEFPKDYDHSVDLIIDPTVVAATLSGSVQSANYGHSATFDNGGNIYTAGRSFGPGYPTTTGALMENFGGGSTDISISKYNPDGSDLMYATYIGGSGFDVPHSIIADPNQQLYIYGTSMSSNFPTTPNAFQSNRSGGSDIVVVALNSTGSAMIGASYFGGTSDDGLNLSELNTNYGDDFRGEIILDAQNNVYIASSTNSNNFPVTTGAFDTSFNTIAGGSLFTINPAQDVIVFKANADLSYLHWATYIGGNESDIGNGLKVDDDGNVYVTGTAGHSNFPTTFGTVTPDWNSGDEKAFVCKLSPDGSTMLRGTFWGLWGEQHSYFIDLDEEGSVHIYGQTNANLPIQPSGTYTTGIGSKQFIAAFTPDLDEVVYSTVFGNGPNVIGFDLVPVAFMVDKCDHIYFSGYYASAGLPTTSDAISTNGNTFYLGVLEPKATGLAFGTYYGNADHVDGGTSRFNKGGVIYQGVCSCTSGNAILNTLPGSWATTQSTFCDVGVFKIDLEIETVLASGVPMPSSSGCAPYNVDFNFTGQDAQSYEWYFGDGDMSLEEHPSHLFESAGSYEVMVVAHNPDACNPTDTFHLVIDVLDGETNFSEISLCGNDQIFLDATTLNATYQWQDGVTTATYEITNPGDYWVDVFVGNCSRRDSFEVTSSSSLDIEIGHDQPLCDIPFMVLDAADSGAVAWEWQDGSTDATFTAQSSGIYAVTVTDTEGCTATDEIELTFGTSPEADLGHDISICEDSSASFDATYPGATYLWPDGSTGATYTTSEPGLVWVELSLGDCTDTDSVFVNFNPPVAIQIDFTDLICNSDCDGTATAIASGGNGSGYTYEWSHGAATNNIIGLCAQSYSLTVTDGEGCTAESSITLSEPPPMTFETITSDVLCPGDNSGSIFITNVSGGIGPYLYSFDDEELFVPEPTLDLLPGGIYPISVMDVNGCVEAEEIEIEEPDEFFIDAGEDIVVKLGEEIKLSPQIFAYTNQEIIWSPDTFLTCVDCQNPQLRPTKTTLYTLTVIDENGCSKTDQVLVTVQVVRDVYIPNVFSPDGNGTNDFFTIFGGSSVQSIVDLKIFDRWGELLFINQNFLPNIESNGWDGKFKGQMLKPAVYAYFVEVEYLDGKTEFFEGDVVLMH